MKAWWLLVGSLALAATPVMARDPHQVALFRQHNPCPATGKPTGACPGWVVDHIYPLCAGGKDEPANMEWQQAHASYIKDRLERDFCACKKGH